ncbi:hypothetical protein Tco_0358758 [Tanacetum coccineum]
MRSSGYLLHELLLGDNTILGRSSSRHSTLEVDRINRQSLEADNGSSPLAYLIPAPSVASTTLSFRKAPIDKLPVLRMRHQVPDRFETTLVESEEDSKNPHEIHQENL